MAVIDYRNRRNDSTDFEAPRLDPRARDFRRARRQRRAGKSGF